MNQKRSKKEDAKLDLILDHIEQLTNKILAVKGLTEKEQIALFINESLCIIQDIERINNAKRNKT